MTYHSKTFEEEYTELKKIYTKENSPNAYKTGYFSHVYKFNKPKSAAQTEKYIVEFLTLKGHQAQKVSTMGVYRSDEKTFTDVIGRVRKIGSGKWTPGGATKGAADISSSIYGVKVEWEVKFSKSDKQTPEQKKFEEAVTKSGGVYIIIRTLDEFIQKYYELMETKKIKLMRDLSTNVGRDGQIDLF